VVDDAEHVPLAIVVAPPTQAFDGILIDWEAQDRCTLYFLGSIFFTPKFADPDQTCVLYARRFVGAPPSVAGEHPQLTRFYPSSSSSPVDGPELWFNGSTVYQPHSWPGDSLAIESQLEGRQDENNVPKIVYRGII